MDLEDLKFPEAVVEAGCSTRLTIYDLPAGAVPVWLEVPDELAGDFLVTDIKVGISSQLSSSGAVPAALFSRRAPLDELLLDAVGAGHPSLSLSVTNVSSGRRRFEGRPIFSCEDSRLARYRRARLVGLGASRVSSLGTLNVSVEPSRKLAPDRIFIPREILERVAVERIEIRTFDVDKKDSDLIEAVHPDDLRQKNLEGDGLFYLSKIQSVGPGKCFVVKFRNRTCAEVLVTGVILGGESLP